MYIKQKSKMDKRKLSRESLPEYSLGGDVFAGAAAGAGTGVAVGGPWGAVIGGVIGAGTGLAKGLHVQKQEAGQEKLQLQNKIRQQRLGSYVAAPEYESLYAMGGMTGMPNAEVEGGESLAMPQGVDAAVEGPSHAQGGVPLNLPGGTKVYSDRLEVPGKSGITFADEHKRLAALKKKEESRKGKNGSTRVTERTIERNIKNIEKEEEALFALQQELNGEAEKERQQQMQASQGLSGQMAPPQDMSGLNRPQMASQGPSAQVPQGIPQMGGLPQGAYGMELPKYGRGDKTPLPDESTLAMQELLNPTYSRIEGLDSPKMSQDLQLDRVSNSPKAVGNFNKTASTIATLAPMAYNLIEGFSKKDKINPADYQNNAGMVAAAKTRGLRYDIDPILRANNAAFQAGARNLATRSRGEQLANMVALSTGLANSNAQAHAQKNNVENQYKIRGNRLTATVGGQNARSSFAAKQYNDEVDNSASRLKGAGLTGLSHLAQQRYKDRQMMKSQILGYNAMTSMYGDVALNSKGEYVQKNLLKPGEEFDLEKYLNQ